MKKNLLFTILLTIFAGFCFAQSGTSDYEKNVLAFNAQGIKLGDSYVTFKAKFPNATWSDNGDEFQKCYMVSSIPNVALALFYFFDDKLVEIRYGYDVQQVNKLGGWDAMAENFISKYGRFNSVDSKESQDIIFIGYTNYYAINRYVEFRVLPKMLVIMFVDTDLEEQMRQKKMKSMDYGF